jgi:hypothetical protein
MWPAKCRQACLRVGRPRNSVGEPDAVNPPVRFDEREVETGHGKASEAPATERAGNCWALPNPPRHLSTLLFFVSTDTTGWPRFCKRRTCVLMYSN